MSENTTTQSEKCLFFTAGQGMSCRKILKNYTIIMGFLQKNPAGIRQPDLNKGVYELENCLIELIIY